MKTKEESEMFNMEKSFVVIPILILQALRILQILKKREQQQEQ